MVEIPEYKRDESKDTKFILKSLKEISFPIGRNLLTDFLKGNYENPSIEKNKLDQFENFGVLNYLSIERINELIESLIYKNYIETAPSVFNHSGKVFKLSEDGKNKFITPGKKPEDNYEYEDGLTEGENIFYSELGEFLKNFNDEQKRAVTSNEEKILCIAGAGSGKTKVLTKRAEFLAKYGKIHGDKILAITFTRKAKEEMEKRLKETGIMVVVETFNSFCEKILLKNGEKIYGKRVKVATLQDKMFSILRALDEAGLTINEALKEYFKEPKKISKNFYELQNIFATDCFNVFDLYKISKLSPEKFREKFMKEKDKASEMIFKIVIYLEKYFNSYGLRTYTDQLHDTIAFFKMHKKYIPGFLHILVDEFQDVNTEQIELLTLLNPKNIFCVGDPRQYIFGWRGSKINYIIDFKKNYPDSKIIYLKKNYRSAVKLVDFMNLSIRDMKLPDLEAGEKNDEGKIKILGFTSEKEEFNFVKERIIESKTPREEIFVLSRTNRDIQDFSNFLKKCGIKHILKTENARDIHAKEGEITLSTVHSAKGLESDLVFVIRCIPSNFPAKYNEHPILEKIKIYDYNKTEEERRLFYVAISRARKELYLTYSGKKHTPFIDDEMKRAIAE